MKEINLRMLTISLLVILVSVSAMSLPSQAAATTLKLTPVRGIIGASVTVTGIGYPVSSSVTISGLFSKVCSTNSTGGITNCSVTVPNAPAGSYIVYSSSGAFGTSAKFTIGSRAHIAAKPISGLPLSTVTITGTHFSWNSKLTVTFNGKKVVTIPAAPVTTSTGTFSLTFVVPSDTPNSYIVSVTDSFNYKANTVYTIT